VDTKNVRLVSFIWNLEEFWTTFTNQIYRTRLTHLREQSLVPGL